jgi:hypothetical protein
MNAHYAPPPAIRRPAVPRAAQKTPLPPSAGTPPGAAFTFTVPLSGSAVGPDGRTYSFQGVVPLTVTETPPPPPPAPHVDYIKDALTGQVVTQAPAGSIMLMEGGGFGPTGRLTWGSYTCVVSSWTDPEIQFLLPKPLTLQTQPFVLYNLKNNQWTLVVKSAPFMITPDTTPPPPPQSAWPHIKGATTDAGLVLTTLPPAGAVFRIQGRNFGAQSGKLLWDNTSIPVLSWSDTEIRTQAPAPPNNVGGRIWLWRGDGRLTFTRHFPGTGREVPF